MPTKFPASLESLGIFVILVRTRYGADTEQTISS